MKMPCRVPRPVADVLFPRGLASGSSGSCILVMGEGGRRCDFIEASVCIRTAEAGTDPGRETDRIECTVRTLGICVPAAEVQEVVPSKVQGRERAEQ